MAAPKARTIQQRFGFADGDLKTPKHDEIMIWLDANIEQVVSRCKGHNGRWTERDKEIHLHPELPRRQSILEALRRLPLPDKPSHLVAKKVWEYIISDRQYVIGFVDMAVWYKAPALYTITEQETYIEPHPMIEKYPSWLSSGKSPIIEKQRFKDYSLANLPRIEIRYSQANLPICFEVKSKIPSLGELLRQIRMYQKYIDASWYVVCDDNKFEAQLKAQGVGFVRYPS